MNAFSKLFLLIAFAPLKLFAQDTIHVSGSDFSVNGQSDLTGDETEVSWAWVETVKPSNDCLTCELRDPQKELAYTEHFADIRQY